MIYILENDDSARNIIMYALESVGYESSGFSASPEFWDGMNARLPQLLLIDDNLPGDDGLEIIKKLRSRPDTHSLPIIIISDKSSEYDKVVGLDSGAADYVTKPFGIMELISRVKALLRRSEDAVSPVEYIYKGLYVCPQKHIVRADGEDVSLTYKEFELLSLLISSVGTVFTRDQILHKIWGYNFDGENRTVDVHIWTLRSKLGAYGGLIETVRGVGYKLGD